MSDHPNKAAVGLMEVGRDPLFSRGHIGLNFYVLSYLQGIVYLNSGGLANFAIPQLLSVVYFGGLSAASRYLLLTECPENRGETKVN